SISPVRSADSAVFEGAIGAVEGAIGTIDAPIRASTATSGVIHRRIIALPHFVVRKGLLDAIQAAAARQRAGPAVQPRVGGAAPAPRGAPTRRPPRGSPLPGGPRPARPRCGHNGDTSSGITGRKC